MKWFALFLFYIFFYQCFFFQMIDLKTVVYTKWFVLSYSIDAVYTRSIVHIWSVQIDINVLRPQETSLLELHKR